MKPLKPALFLSIIIAINLFFAGTLILWMIFMLKSFKVINSQAGANAPVLEKVDFNTYSQLFPYSAPSPSPSPTPASRK